MAFTAYHNIDGATATVNELIPIKTITKDKISSILISNTDNASVTVSLYLFKESTSEAAAETYYFCKDTIIPVGASVLFDDASLVSFDSISYSLYIAVGSSDTVDVMINK
tara:strand:+ start:204 stop:533 length:330 start_codon:yes stop_codon:yes gene_type:complete